MTTDSLKSQSCAKHVFYIDFVSYATCSNCAYYAGIMLNAFATYYAHHNRLKPNHMISVLEEENFGKFVALQNIY